MRATRTYDRFEQLTFDAQISAAIIGNRTKGEFELMGLPGYSRERVKALVASGMFFFGVVGLVGGELKTALQEPFDDAMLDAIAAAFLSHIEGRLDSALIARLEQKALDGWLARLARA